MWRDKIILGVGSVVILNNGISQRSRMSRGDGG